MITINVTLRNYCDNCPYMELEVMAEGFDGKIYDCAHAGLCSRLWQFLQTKK